jgi:hypothetical protein
MPRPGYIICSASGSLDQYTNAVSIFGVIESVTVGEARPQPGGTVAVTPLSMRVIATWLKGDEDAPDHKFETQIVAFVQGREKEVIRADFDPFVFNTIVRRFVLPEVVFPPTLAIPAGLLRFESRIRRKDAPEWGERQEYLIVVEQERAVEAAVVPPAAPTAPPEGNQA